LPKLRGEAQNKKTKEATRAMDAREVPAPFDRFRTVVRPEWIDHNQHMNMGYYLVVFDLATDAFLDWVGLDAAHRREQAITTFTLEGHITYQREVRLDDRLRFETRLIGFDAKRIHYIHEMYHEAEGYLAATNELMSLHVSRETRRGAPMAEAVQQRLAAIKAAHDALPPNPNVGRVIGLTAKPTTG
jgi:acyl-CoA thioester hydrolase